jgi:hypothetical protein
VEDIGIWESNRCQNNKILEDKMEMSESKTDPVVKGIAIQPVPLFPPSAAGTVHLHFSGHSYYCLY